MSKKNRERREGKDEVDETSDSGSASWLPTVLAAAALVFAFYLWTDARQVGQETAKHLRATDAAIAQLTSQVAAARQQAKPQPQGPDPNKVYPIKLDGAPTRGNPTAPIVIAEFSDYQ
jgi:protein-disulfide isomerase